MKSVILSTGTPLALDTRLCASSCASIEQKKINAVITPINQYVAGDQLAYIVGK